MWFAFFGWRLEGDLRLLGCWKWELKGRQPIIPASVEIFADCCTMHWEHQKCKRHLEIQLMVLLVHPHHLPTMNNGSQGIKQNLPYSMKIFLDFDLRLCQAFAYEWHMIEDMMHIFRGERRRTYQFRLRSHELCNTWADGWSHMRAILWPKHSNMGSDILFQETLEIFKETLMVREIHTCWQI